MFQKKIFIVVQCVPVDVRILAVGGKPVRVSRSGLSVLYLPLACTAAAEFIKFYHVDREAGTGVAAATTAAS